MLAEFLEGVADFVASTWAVAREGRNWKGEKRRPTDDARADRQATWSADWNARARNDRLARRRGAKSTRRPRP